jgi:hypothetical protein
MLDLVNWLFGFSRQHEDWPRQPAVAASAAIGDNVPVGGGD